MTRDLDGPPLLGSGLTRWVFSFRTRMVSPLARGSCGRAYARLQRSMHERHWGPAARGDAPNREPGRLACLSFTIRAFTGRVRRKDARSRHRCHDTACPLGTRVGTTTILALANHEHTKIEKIASANHMTSQWKCARKRATPHRPEPCLEMTG
jgi:hypothetical protein